MFKIAHIDDDEAHLELTRIMLEENGRIKCHGFTDPVQALTAIEKREFDCIIIDYKMPTINGIDLASKIREITDAPIIIYTGHGSEEVAEKAFHSGIDDYIRKDVDVCHIKVLEKRIEDHIESYHNRKMLGESEKRYREYSRKLELLLEHIVKLNTANSIMDVIDISYTILARLFSFETGSFALVKDDELVHFFRWGEHPDIVYEMPLNGKGISVRATKLGTSQYVPDVTLDPDYVYVEGYNLKKSKTELDIPVKVNDNVIGVLNLESIRTDAFSREDRNIVNLLVNQAASAIERIYTNADKLKFTKETLAKQNTLEEVAVFTTSMLHTIIPTDKVAVAVREGKVLKPVSTVGKRTIVELDLDQPSINARTVRTGKAQLVNDTRKDPDYFAGEGSDSLTMLSEMCIPIIHDNDVLGTINFEHQHPNRFSERDAEIAEGFADEIAEAVSRVHEVRPVDESVIVEHAKNRSTLERYHDLLSAVYSNETVLHKILNKAAIQWKPGKELVNDLVAKGYLTKKKVSACRYVYKITDEGVKAIEAYETIIERLMEQ